MPDLDEFLLPVCYDTLHGTTPVPCSEPLVFWAWFESAQRHVGNTMLPEGTRISTVFTGLAGLPREEPPPLFESIVLAARRGLRSTRQCYTTWAEATQGHAGLVAEAQQAPAP